jgi:DNA-binding CsgD family transcriptional regulator
MQQTTQRQELERARRELVGASGAVTSDLRTFVDQQFARVYRPGTDDSLAEAVQFIAYLLEAEGRFDDGIAEVDLALSSRPPVHEQGHLHALRAAMLAMVGRSAEARQSLAESEAFIEAHRPAGFSKWLILAETARMQLLEDPSPRLFDLLEANVEAGNTLDQIHLLCWYIPYLAAHGDRRTARPLVRRLRAQLQAEPHRWRNEELAGFQAWLSITKSGPAPVESGRLNPLGSWRLATLDLFAATLRRDPESANAARQRQTRSAAAARSTDFGPAAIWDAFVEASLGLPVDRLQLQPPHDVTLPSLATSLAAANAIALGGTIQEARIWLTWVKGLERRGIESSLEWPVSRSRIEALLELRAGNLQSARAALHRARVRTAESGYAVEAAIAELQLQQITPIVDASGDDPSRAVTDLLVQQGIDPLPHVYAARVHANARLTRRSELTPRETQVLELLGEGLTYKGVAVRLGIKWPTVQTTTHRIYEKLGVSSRHEAVKSAKRSGLL